MVVDVLEDGNTPENSKFMLFYCIIQPTKFSEFCMLIGMFGLFIVWIHGLSQIRGSVDKIFKYSNPI